MSTFINCSVGNGAPTYCLVKFLVGILFPLLSLEYTAQNSSQFVWLINNFECLRDECLLFLSMF